jgi:ABC-2 type transport system permease protein
VGRGETVRGVLAVVGVECAKLVAQWKARAALAACLAAPVAFTLAIKLSSSVPEDTLFGRWVKLSGFAVPLVVLGFAALWAFPALTSVVGGDLFSAEDRYGTWPTLLTRSRTRGELFAGKVLTAMLFSLLVVGLLGVVSTAAGVLGVGRQPLVGLSGTSFPPGRALALVTLAWASVLPPVFAFTALAVLVSVASRSSAAGLGVPVLLGLLMEIDSFVDCPEMMRRMLLTPPFGSWHGLFTFPPYYRPLVHGIAISALYLFGCTAGAFRLLKRRDMGG